MQTAIELAMLIYSRYSDYEKYLIAFGNERLTTSWMRFSNQDVSDMINKKREFADVMRHAISRKEVLIFDPSTEPVDLQEIKYFRFPNYQCESYMIRQIEDASLPDRKRLRCRVYIGDNENKESIVKIIQESIECLKKSC